MKSGDVRFSDTRDVLLMRLGHVLYVYRGNSFHENISAWI